MKIFKLLFIAFILCLIGFSLTLDPIFGIRYTVSPSLPYKCFISRPITQLEKNQYVTLVHPKSAILIAKQIIGLSGDEINIRENYLYINNQKFGHILENSKTGRKLYPISEGKIPEGFVCVYAPHRESFDSRYQEFGLVKIDQLRERLCPLF